MILINDISKNVILQANNITLNVDHAIADGKRYYCGINNTDFSIVNDVILPDGDVNWWTYDTDFELTDYGLQEYRKIKEKEISDAACEVRKAGFTSTATGTEYTYGGLIEQQIYIIGAAQSGKPTKYNVKENGVRKRVNHTNAEINQVLSDGFDAMQLINDHENDLITAIETATTYVALSAISW